MNQIPHRDELWDKLDQTWDLIIIGGGITGAGIFNLASRKGLKTLLVEQRDFAFGTSSRSSKLVHGGLRYLKNLQFNVTRESVWERERLLNVFPNLIKRMPFILPIYQRYKFPVWQAKLSLRLYDKFAGIKQHGELDKQNLEKRCKSLDKNNLSKAFYYHDAVVDDSRLVIRNLFDGFCENSFAINYAKAEHLLFNKSNQVKGIFLKDMVHKSPIKEVFGNHVINATGIWADEVRKDVATSKIIRKLRGSHLIFSNHRIPINDAFLMFHPIDGRSLFAIPWESSTIIGTTDLDHPKEHERKRPEPFITSTEIDYLLFAANTLFPDLHLSEKDIISTYSGLRPIVFSREESPSKASRKHKIISEDGLTTIAGGKLTTYFRMAHDVLRNINVKINLPAKPYYSISKSLKYNTKYSTQYYQRLSGIYGNYFTEFLESIKTDEINTIADTSYCWAELRWALREEYVFHLEDLLLRRTRIGNLCPSGGTHFEKEIKHIVQSELHWDEKKWKDEWDKYQNLWHDCYYLPN